MFLVADLNGMSKLATMSARFPISHIVVSVLTIVVEWHPVFLIADVLHVTRTSAKITNNFCGIDGYISRF